MQTLILDSSQISQWSECPTAWSNRGLIQINKKDPDETFRPSDAIAAGSLGHKYLELYYTELALSNDSAAAARLALDFNPDEADKTEKQFPLDVQLRARVKQRIVDYFMMYGPNRDYKPSFKKKASIEIRKGLPHDVLVKDPLIEKGFSYKLYEDYHYLFVLEGRIDFIGEAQDGTLLWMDHKFQFREHELYHKSIQFRNYSLVTGLNLAVVNYIRLHDKVQPRTFIRQPLSFSSLEMKYWKEELIEIYKKIAKQVALGNFPQNRNSCAGAWGKPCQYTPLCEEYNPTIRAAIQKRDFTQRKTWKPW
jgi:hypothetical protein